ncbi:sensor histidine kinase [Hydrotalea sp.]|uniref:sensor histidine kinase n=1 Tax=Hydrotalea sp. TaxID=2881279 RepID=UPI003D14FB3D
MASARYLYVYTILPSFGMVFYKSEDFHVFLVEAIVGFVRIFSFALIYFYLKQLFEKEYTLRKLQEEKAARELENAYLRQQELKAQKEKLQYEQALLRAQINHHFLHNTLNTLFSQALDYSPELADNILKLSDLIRYSIESLDFESRMVRVRREISQLQTFIEIHNLRFKNNRIINLEITGEMNGQSVPPLSFITLVENAFKYGDMSDPQNPLIIKINLFENTVHFYCKNKIRQDSSCATSYNIGLKNLKRRLDITFEGCYNLFLSKCDGFFISQLTIKTPVNAEMLSY